MTYAELLILASKIHMDTTIDETIMPSMVEFGQNALEKYLVSQNIFVPEMSAFSSEITPFIASGVNSLALPSDFLRMVYFHITNQLPSPVITLSLGAGAGTLGTGTYYYRVSATNATGETIPSTEVSLAITGPDDIKIDWTEVTGATGYKVYGRTTGAEKLIATVAGGSTVTYTDSGALTPSGAMPVLNTTGSTKFELLPGRATAKYAGNYSTKAPLIYEIINTTMYLDGITDQAYAYEMLYLKKLPTLTASTITNTWSDKYPQALLYSTLAALVPSFFPDDPRGSSWKKQRDEEFGLMLNQIKAETA